MPLLLAIIAAAYVPGLLSATEVGRWSVALAGTVLLLLWGARPPHPPSRALWAGAAFLLYGLASLAWTYDWPSTVLALVRWGTVGGLTYLAAAGRATAGECLAGLSVGLLASVPFAVLQVAGYAPVVSLYPPGHAVGLFLAQSTLVGVAVPVITWCLLTFRWVRAYLLLPLLMVPGAKQVILMVGAAGLAFGLARLESPDHRRGLVLGAAGLGLLALAYLALTGLWNHTLDERLEMWQVSWAAFLVRPWGWGLGAYPMMFGGYEYAHNDFVQLLVEVGPAVLLVGAVLGAALLAPGPAAEKAALAALLASALLWWPLHEPASAALAAVLVGGLLRRRTGLVRAGPGVRGDRGAGARPGRGDGAGAVRGPGVGGAAVPLRPAHPAGGRAVPAGLQLLGRER